MYMSLSVSITLVSLIYLEVGRRISIIWITYKYSIKVSVSYTRSNSEEIRDTKYEETDISDALVYNCLEIMCNEVKLDWMARTIYIMWLFYVYNCSDYIN